MVALVHRSSPNFNDRPAGAAIDMIVLHYTDVPTAADALAILCDPAREVSSHYLIDEDGTVFKLVDEDKRAWHAGLSYWNGRENINHNSIGIELQNHGWNYYKQHGAWPPYTAPLMGSLVSLIRDIQTRYPITLDNIVGHNHVIPRRKMDPGPHFDWAWLKERFAS
jgi:N-acetylmuramoyl-L-alanine amidase